ncbi:unnamed protein product [Eruca vesicaria subsp. sativa]|uniref:LEC14B homolog n=1 Tax=Eruca vesicaria subsp. sativa TaxID=29727 RepID=A0ABC8IZ01_ERUVS|nr:unnamed protein product [Eruca vesicaria subsp. sativa]
MNTGQLNTNEQRVRFHPGCRVNCELNCGTIDAGKGYCGVGSSSSGSSHRSSERLADLDHEISHVTKLKFLLMSGLAIKSLGDISYLFPLWIAELMRELVAGSSDDSIYVYDLEANRVSLRTVAHTSDVNTVCFADESGHLILAGGDDNLCKVWDRRCFIGRDKPAGVLVGHLEGVTFIDSRGDGRYFISNGKDQTIKLWDIRKMSSTVPARHEVHRNYEWDYRWMDYPSESRDLKHPYDQSVSTYKGHSVLRTLIRCYFSPAHSTGQKYIYTGSNDSSVHIYDLESGDKVAALKHHNSPVRNCNWHPHYPTLISSSWDGNLVKWEFPGSGEPPIMSKKRVRRRHF